MISRSENMARVKSKDTSDEIFFRKLLYKKGVRYFKNVKNLPGKPDIYVSKKKTAIFVNGCFRHMHENCKYSSIPKTNREFREKKLKANAKRDLKNEKKLNELGIKTATVRTCEIKKMKKDEKYAERFAENFIKENALK